MKNHFILPYHSATKALLIVFVFIIAMWQNLHAQTELVGLYGIKRGEEIFLRHPFKTLIKKETDKAVDTYKKHMLKLNFEIRELLDEIYGYLEEIWKEEYEKMNTDAQQSSTVNCQQKIVNETV